MLCPFLTCHHRAPLLFSLPEASGRVPTVSNLRVYSYEGYHACSPTKSKHFFSRLVTRLITWYCTFFACARMIEIGHVVIGTARVSWARVVQYSPIRVSAGITTLKIIAHFVRSILSKKKGGRNIVIVAVQLGTESYVRSLECASLIMRIRSIYMQQRAFSQQRESPFIFYAASHRILRQCEPRVHI